MNNKETKERRRMNSREKGKRGERQWRDELRAHGFAARRGQQFAGGAESPDVVCEELAWIHFEVKAVERLNIEDSMEQARKDCGARKAERGKDGHLTPALSPRGGEGDDGRPMADGRWQKVPVVAHKRNHRRWLVTMEAETFFRLLRGDVPETRNAEGGARNEVMAGEMISAAACAAASNENNNNGKETHEDQKQ
jgi:hypothetical protein